MGTDEYTNVEAHEGRPVGIKLELDFSPDEARRLTELAANAFRTVGPVQEVEDGIQIRA